MDQVEHAKLLAKVADLPKKKILAEYIERALKRTRLQYYYSILSSSSYSNYKTNSYN
jgi:hypothetical protein